MYSRLVKVAQKINGHWDAFVVADLPLQDGKSAVDTIDKAIAWKDDNAYDSERSAVCWPQVSDYTGRVFHLSTLYVVESLRAGPARTRRYRYAASTSATAFPIAASTK